MTKDISFKDNIRKMDDMLRSYNSIEEILDIIDLLELMIPDMLQRKIIYQLRHDILSSEIDTMRDRVFKISRQKWELEKSLSSIHQHVRQLKENLEEE